MSALLDESKKKSLDWDEVVKDRPITDRRMGWDERDGSKAAAWGAIWFFLAALGVIAALLWLPKYPS